MSSLRIVRRRWVLLWGLAALAWQPQSEPPVTALMQVVLRTSRGDLVIELFPQAAPRHANAFLERVQDGAYLGTAFHRAIPGGIIQGGDPLSRDPARREGWGTGGLFQLPFEASSVSHTRGTISAVLVPGELNSGGSQFFICVTDQTQLDGQYTAFGRVVEGLEIVEQISLLPTDSEQRLLERVEIQETFLRKRPPPEELPFSNTPIEELERYRVLLRTNLGELELSFFPASAPEHVRQFLRFAELGIYEGTTFHRVVPGFVIQGGSAGSRTPPLPQKLARHLKPLKAEFNQRKHLPGIVSMARSDDPDSAVDSFFIVLAANPNLDGKYTVFGQVTRGMEVVEGIGQVPTRGETPIVPVRIESVSLRQD